MSRLIIIAGFLILSAGGMAQPLQHSINLSDSVASAEFEWVDLDNDGLLDVLLLLKANSGRDYIGIIKGDTTVTALAIEKSFPIIPYDAFLLADYDRDNAIDIIISGKVDATDTTIIYRNTGAFQFQETTTAIPHFSIGSFADLDEDATPELILSGSGVNGPYTMFLKQVSGNSWKIVHDSLKLQCLSVETVDADGDGDVDVFVSGRLDGGELMSGFLINKGNFYFKPAYITPLAGYTSPGDLNADGFFEIILMGEDDSGLWHTKKYQNSSGVYTIQDLPMTLKNGRPFIADFDHDGTADINYSGIGDSGDIVNVIQHSTSATSLLPNVVSCRFGDRGHNGNLEYAYTYFNGDSWSLIIGDELSQEKNSGPGSPGNAVALPVFNRVFMYWDKPADDHTSVASLTYDVFLNGISNYQAGEFDLINERRLKVTHGNNGTKNFRLLKHVAPDDLKFAIQAIDNSFHSGNVCLGGAGVNTGTCAIVVTTEEISACTHENIVFTAPSNALWFSFADGFLGTGTGISFSSDASPKGDTIFYYQPATGEGCSSLKAWSIEINDDTLKIEKAEKYACAGAPVELSVEPGWETVEWSSQNSGNLGSSNSIRFNLTDQDSVTVRLANAYGCQVVRKTALKISEPQVNVSADHYRITSGSEVQLQASGAQRYSWAPGTGLNQTDIPNPVASPATSIQYVVTGYDSIDCQAQATVTVTVESSGFIPNLFSPNDDGQNDQLRIYGLSSAERFSLSIYDREGSLVYKTSDVSEAVQQGWDGTKNGNKQPPGVYFWKVKGEIGSGRLLLNGKDSGSVVLIR